MLSTRDPPQTKGHRLKVKGWKKIFHAHGDQKKAGVAIIPDKIDFEDCKKRQRRTMPNNVQTTSQLHSSHVLVN